jgi:molybdopterin adenylyltransferase
MAPQGLAVRAAVLTISTSKARGEGEDESGRRLSKLASRIGAEVVGPEVIADDRGLIEERLRFLADEEGCDLVLTTGGTGFAPSDVTPEATMAVIEREAPGIAEAMRAASRDHTRHWMLSRAVAGIRGSTLIVNLPGSPASIEQAGEAIAPALPHALELIAGRGAHH